MASKKHGIKPYIELLRPGWWLACFFIGIVPGLLAIFTTEGSISEFFHYNSIIWALGYWASVVGIYAINDVIGIKEDSIVNPKRPLPSHRITPKSAMIFGVILATLGILLWWIAFTNIFSTGIQLTCMLLMIIYSAWYKHGFFLGLSAALIPVGIWIALAPFDWLMVALFVFIFCWEMCLDVPENILHYEGDKKYSPATLGVIMGPEKLAKIGIIFATMAIGGLVWIGYLLGFSYIFPVFALLGGITLVFSQLSIRNDISPMKCGKALGMVMLAMFLINVGLILHCVLYSYVFD